METAVLDDILQTVSTACAGNGSIQGYATSLFGYLIALDFVLAILLNLLSFGGGQNFIGQVISKCLGYGFWLWIIQNWGSICNSVINSLSIAGTSFGSIPANVLEHPSRLIDMGLEAAKPLWEFISAQTSMTGILGSLGIYLLALLGAIGIFLAFAAIGIQVFVTYIEFYIASALMLLFIPFATNKYTEKFAQSCLGGVIAQGVKLMFLGAIISLAGPMLNNLQVSFEGTPSWQHIGALSMAPWAIAFLSWQAPSMAAGFMSGGPSLSAGTLTAGASAVSSSASGGLGRVAAAASGTAGMTGAAVARSKAAPGGRMKGALQGMGNFAFSKSYNRGKEEAEKGGIFG